MQSETSLPAAGGAAREPRGLGQGGVALGRRRGLGSHGPGATAAGAGAGLAWTKTARDRGGER